MPTRFISYYIASWPLIKYHCLVCHLFDNKLLVVYDELVISTAGARCKASFLKLTLRSELYLGD